MSQGYLEYFFESSTVDWKGIYLLPGQNIINTKHCSFQYKILNNVLYLNKLLFKFRKVKSPLCSIYKSAEETIIHLFSEFLCAQYIWNQTQILLFRIYYYPWPHNAEYHFWFYTHQYWTLFTDKSLVTNL